MKLSIHRGRLSKYALIAVPVLALLVYFGLVLANVYTVAVILTGTSEIAVEYGEKFEDPGASAVYYGSIFQREPLDLPVTAEGSVDTEKLGEYTVRYHAEHERISGEATRTVRVVDTKSPVLTLLGDATVIMPVGTEYREAGCTAIDNYSGDLTEAVEIDGVPDPATPGTYTLTYSVRDSSGNAGMIQRTVIYQDITAPVITLVGGSELEIEYGDVYEDPGVYAFDDCCGDVTAQITGEGTVDPLIPGTYTLMYTVSDEAGNAATAHRTVHVVDSTAPVLSLSGEDSVILFVGDPYEDAGCTALDNCDGDLTQQVEVSSTVNLYWPGEYTVIYTVTDSSGNTASVTRTVTVCRGIVYLTYDDGPSRYTERLLEILDEYGAKAAFFLVHDTRYIEIAALEAAAGHTVAIHSLTHDYEKIYASEEAYFEDLYAMQQIIQEYTGQKSMMVRFPGGSSNTVSWRNKGIMTRLTKLVEEEGFHYFDWNVGSHDASDDTSWEESAQNVIRGITCQRVSVVLMHDSRASSIKATREILEWGNYNGYLFLALPYDGPGCHHRINN